MCGRFIQKSERKIITEEFYVQEFLDEVIISYNIAPGQNAGIILNDGKNVYAQYKWGLVPSWAKDSSIGNKMINARAETVREKPSFRNAFKSRRCLVPTDGFYEWKQKEKYKIPYYIYSKSEIPISMAGLWEGRKDKEGNTIHTFTIITTEANSALEELHHRMPVIIPPDKRALWLDHQNTDPGELSSLLKPYDAGALTFHEVSRFVNSPKNNAPECIAPVSDSA
jgi:putative SOS response-associated peptidase YedK